MGRSTLKSQLKAHKQTAAVNTKPTKSKVTTEVVEPVPQKAEPVKQKKAKKEDDYQSEVLSKKELRKLKKLAQKAVEEEDDDEEEEQGEGFIDDEAEEASDEEMDLNKLAESASESELEEEEEDEEEDDEDDVEEEEQEEEESEEESEEDPEAEDVPFSDVEVDSDADIVPHTKLTINNIAALKESLARIQLPWAKHSFVEHQSIISDEKTEVSIKDIYDDTERELAFYKQGLDAVKQGRANLIKLKVPFSRPVDYFAEMVKSDEHMDKLKNKLLTEAANKKASEDSKRQRQLKKFGKQVQHETLQERAKQKRESLEKVKSLKKRRANNEFAGDDDFQIALEEATREGRENDNKRHKPNGKRMAKNAKYGMGGRKSGSRRNDAKSSADVSEFSSKKMKNSRPGKSKRSRR